MSKVDDFESFQKEGDLIMRYKCITNNLNRRNTPMKQESLKNHNQNSGGSMIITELVTVWSEDNPKKINSDGITRQNYEFTSLEELADFSRTHPFLAYPQESGINGGLTNQVCRELYIGGNILWIEIDADMNPNKLYNKFKEVRINGFFYYTDAYFNKGTNRIRIGVEINKTIPIDKKKALQQAQRLIKILGYSQNFIKKINSSYYNPSASFAPILKKEKDGWASPNYKFFGKTIWVYSDGKPFELNSRMSE